MIARVAALAACLCLAACGRESPRPSPTPSVRTIEIKVDGDGYTPAKTAAKAGQPLLLVFTRTEDNECVREIKVPGQPTPIALPLDQPVSIPVTMPTDGELVYTCGMDMFRGVVAVQP